MLDIDWVDTFVWLKKKFAETTDNTIWTNPIICQQCTILSKTWKVNICADRFYLQALVFPESFFSTARICEPRNRTKTKFRTYISVDLKWSCDSDVFWIGLSHKKVDIYSLEVWTFKKFSSRGSHANDTAPRVLINSSTMMKAKRTPRAYFDFTRDGERNFWLLSEACLYFFSSSSFAF